MAIQEKDVALWGKIKIMRIVNTYNTKQCALKAHGRAMYVF